MKIIIKILLPFILFQITFADIQEIKNLNEEIKNLENEITPIKSEILSLSGQILILDNEIKNKESHRKLLDKKINILQNQIVNETEESFNTEQKKEVEKNKVKRLTLDTFREEKRKSFFENFDFLKKISEYFGLINNKSFDIKNENENKVVLAELSNKKLDEEYKIANINEKKLEIKKVQNKIKEDQKEILEIIKSKNILLGYSKNKQKLFEDKIEENKRKMLSSLEEIKKAQKNQKIYVKKIQEKEKVISEEVAQTDPYDISKFKDDGPDFIWPVDIQRGITADFMDKAYKEQYGIDHIGIDIRAAQGTEVKAAANAFVLKVEEDGLNYSYVILVHKGDEQTVYGHLSKINVKEGTVVLKGDIIGLSGGTPGTNGAGLLTSGPHLHFEFHKKGSPVNPIEYMPKN